MVSTPPESRPPGASAASRGGAALSSSTMASGSQRSRMEHLFAIVHQTRVACRRPKIIHETCGKLCRQECGIEHSVRYNPHLIPLCLKNGQFWQHTEKHTFFLCQV